jgi:mannitol/fructose-specific phosphotransferase system IIA component (Ntr-type)
MVDSLIEAKRLLPDRKKILIDKLLEREALSSTGIGGGVAIPHASGENIEQMLVAIGQVPGGVEYEAIDDEPVELVFMIIGSERVPRVHLQLLATIVRACKNSELVKELKTSDNGTDIYKLIEQFDNG